MKILKIHTLKKGWCEWDHLLLHAAFQILVDFLEKDKPKELVNWNSDPPHRNAWKEMRALYTWWTKTRPARQDPLEAKGLKRPPMIWRRTDKSGCEELVPYDPKEYPDYEKAFKKSRQLEAEWEAEDQRNLHRLVEVRSWLWC